MAAPLTADPASPWVVMQDFSKNVVTVAIALIGFTVTFSSQLLGKTDFPTPIALYFAWGLALIAAFFGFLAHAFIIAYLKKGTKENPAVACANIAFWVLFFSIVALAIFGYLAVSRSGPTTTAIAATETAVASAPNLSGDKNSKWSMKSLTYNTTQATFDVIVNKENSPEQIAMTIDAGGKIIAVRR